MVVHFSATGVQYVYAWQIKAAAADLGDLGIMHAGLRRLEIRCSTNNDDYDGRQSAF